MTTKVLSILLCISFLFSANPTVGAVTVSAGSGELMEYLSDGSYFVLEPLETTKAEHDARADRSTITGNRSAHYCNSSGEKQWSMKLTGTFTYNGVTASCTAASVTYTIHNSAWQYQSKSATMSGNTAYGSLTMVKKLLGITVQTVTKSLTLSCDKDGNLS